ncbi:hypothetical protein CF328_g5825 [Tilletia controversa]|nr:hypothetical protein CF328_g5825 [Tilletia controversa]
MRPSTGPRKRRRGKYDAHYLECVDCDGEADDPFTTYVGPGVVEMCAAPEPLPPAALQAAARTIRATLGAAAANAGTLQEVLHASDVDRDDAYDAYAASNGYNDEDDCESDFGSGDENSDMLLPINSSDPDPDHRPISSRSRFIAWHNRMAVVFELLYGPNAKRRSVLGPPDIITTCKCPAEARNLKLVIEIYDVGPPFPKIFHTCAGCLFEVLIHAGLFPATPSRPQAAFTIRFIRLYQSLVNVAGISATNMANVFQQLLRNGVGFQRERWTYQVSDSLRQQLKPALNWLTVVERYCDKMALDRAPPWSPERHLLAEDDLDLNLAQLADSCPACFHRFQDNTTADDEAPQAGAPQVIISLDGNFTQKRRAKFDTISRQAFPPRRFLSKRQVRAAEELMGRTAGEEPDQDSCVAKIRAADAVAPKSVADLYEINGVMGACCRHDIPLVMCDIDTPGERHYYAIALINAITQAVGAKLEHIGIAYDIGCRFQPSGKVASALGSALKVTWVVPVFHVYGHTYSCQLRFSPRNTKGFGMTDGEGMERVWSGLANLITSTRGMRRGERRFCLEERCAFIATSRRVNLFDILNAKGKRLEVRQLKARRILMENFDITCVPSQYRVELDSVGQVHSAQQSDEASSQFVGIDPARLRMVWRMSVARLSQLRQEHRPSRNEPLPNLSAVGINAQKLLRSLAEVQLLNAMMYARPASISKGYNTTTQLRKATVAEKRNATKTMSALNLALNDRQAKLDSALIARRSGTRIPAAVLLTSQTLYSEDTFRLVERLAQEADPSPDTLPWWSSPPTAAAMDAFEELCRISEEQIRLSQERTSALSWIDQRIRDLQAAPHHFVYLDAIDGLRHLREHWTGVSDLSASLLPQDDLQAINALDDEGSASSGGAEDAIPLDEHASPFL